MDKNINQALQDLSQRLDHVVKAFVHPVGGLTDAVQKLADAIKTNSCQCKCKKEAK